MNLPRLTLGEAKTELADYLPNGEENSRLNLVIEKIITKGKYTGLVVRNAFVIYDSQFTLPMRYETCIGAKVNEAPQYIHDPWYEVIPGSRNSAYPKPLDMGDGFVCFREPETVNPNGCFVRLLLENPADAGKAFTFAGQAPDGGVGGIPERVEFSSVLAHELVINNQWFFTLTRFEKARTLGRVIMQAQDPDGEWVNIALYEPEDTKICLRRYSFPAVGRQETQVVALCKIRFTKAIEDTDVLPVSSIYALRMGLEAVSYEKSGSFNEAIVSWNIAVKTLDDALSEHRGSAMRTAPVIVRASAGSRLRAFR